MSELKSTKKSIFVIERAVLAVFFMYFLGFCPQISRAEDSIGEGQTSPQESIGIGTTSQQENAGIGQTQPETQESLGTGSTSPNDSTGTGSTEPEDSITTPSSGDDGTKLSDLELYQKYILYKKYEKKQQYLKYKRFIELQNNFRFDNKKKAKKIYSKIKKYAKKYKKNPVRYAKYADKYNNYINYGNYKKEYENLKAYAGYSSYSQYDLEKYDEYADCGTEKYKEGYERYQEAIEDGTVKDPGQDEIISDPLGPEIKVGLVSYTKNDLRDSPFKIHANKEYNIKNKSGEIIAKIPAEKGTRVKYLSDKNFTVYDADTKETLATIYKEIYFDAADGDNTDMIFDISKPSSSFDQYRGKIKLRYYDSSESDQDRIWVINTLPLEQYTWGMGEITGTGPSEFNRIMTTIYRTYGYWKIKYSTKYAAQGFKVDATSGSQIYYGYDWETSHESIRKAALETQGKIITYDKDIAITPYSSWTDGRTRSFYERWGSKEYPWCQSVSDPYGKHPTLGTSDLENAGNHMVGLSAHGALNLANNSDWSWEKIIKYYFTGISVSKPY